MVRGSTYVVCAWLGGGGNASRYGGVPFGPTPSAPSHTQPTCDTVPEKRQIGLP